jgi:hypothetical protein
MEIRLVREPIPLQIIKESAARSFGTMTKAVVDIEQGVMAIGGQLHADEELFLMEQTGAKRENVWGVNILIEEEGTFWVQFDSMINIKPHLGNRSRHIESEEIQKQIKDVVHNLIAP